jgi:hypothetical protein
MERIGGFQFLARKIPEPSTLRIVALIPLRTRNSSTARLHAGTAPWSSMLTYPPQESLPYKLSSESIVDEYISPSRRSNAIWRISAATFIWLGKPSSESATHTVRCLSPYSFSMTRMKMHAPPRHTPVLMKSPGTLLRRISVTQSCMFGALSAQSLSRRSGANRGPPRAVRVYKTRKAPA